MSQYPYGSGSDRYGSDPVDRSSPLGEPGRPFSPAETAPVDYLAPNHTQPGPGQPDSGYAQPPGFTDYTQPGVGHFDADPYQVVAPYSAGGNYYPPISEHPSATTSLILGLLGLFLFPPLSYVALFLGAKARRETLQNPQLYRDSGFATAGWVTGIIGSVMCSLYILVLIFAVMLMLGVVLIG